MPAEVDALPDRTHVLCMTRGHAADRPVLERIFATVRGFAFRQPRIEAPTSRFTADRPRRRRSAASSGWRDTPPG